jgi:adenylosuccinate synthase
VQVASSVALLIRPYVEKGQGGRSLQLGSTHQGTGPAAVARTARHALRLWDVQHAVAGDEAARAAVLGRIAETCRETQPDRFGRDAVADDRYHREVLEENLTAWRGLEEALGPFCVDYTRFLLEALRQGDRRVLLEGCNGLLLDYLHGALPHVTSASTGVSAMLSGANLAPADAGTVTVVMAAYATCLGKRPFPTEMPPALAAPLLTRCNEVDVAVGAPRRLGWLDLPALRKALAGCAGAVLHLNKLDALTGTSPLRICTHHRVDDQELAVMADDPDAVAQARPRYLELPGWTEDLRGARRWEDLPAAARAYVQAVAERLPCPIVSIGTGPANLDHVSLR